MNVVFLSVELVLLSVVVYLWFLALVSVAARQRERPCKSPKAKRKYLILIPAHNEAKVIERALASLKRLDYPRSRYDVVVIADNCDDDTVEKVANDELIMCLERHDTERRGKGFALQWAFEEIRRWDRRYDAYVIMDADSTMAADFLIVMEGKLARGAKVLQGYVQVVNPEKSPTSSLIFLGWSMNQRLRHAATSRLGYLGFLLGNGMCVASEVLDTHGWNATSILEDVEYGLMLRLLGFQIVFVPEAKVYAQNPSTYRHAESQRIRWDHGRFLIMRRFLSRLVKSSLQRRDPGLLLSALELLIPPYALLVSGTLCVFLTSVILSLAFSSPWYQRDMVLWGMILLGLAGYSLLGLVVSGASPKVWKSLLHVPRFLLWRICINIKGSFRQGSTKWVKTARED